MTRDNKIIIVNVFIAAVFIFLFIVDMWEINELNSANEKLKKEKYEIQAKCKQLEEEKLQRIIKGE